jgi:Uma2 family endonuclease
MVPRFLIVPPDDGIVVVMRKGLAVMSPAPMLTVDEYLQTPESSLPQELAYGEWRVAEAPTPRHQSTVFAFGLAFDRLVRPGRLGRVYLSPVDVILDRARHLVVQPDLLFISRARLGIVTDRIWGAPDVVLEVLSPGPRIGELHERIGWFASYGVRECWLVHQDEDAVEILSFAEGAVRDRWRFGALTPIRSDVLPEWRDTLATTLAQCD